MYGLQNDSKNIPRYAPASKQENLTKEFLKDLFTLITYFEFPLVTTILNLVFIFVVFKVLPNVVYIPKQYVASFGCY